MDVTGPGEETDVVVERLARAAAEGEEAALGRARAQLARRAEAEGVLDVAVRTVPSPVGDLLLAATPAGVVRVAFEREDHDVVLAALAERLGVRVLRAPARLEGAARQLGEYFAGTRRAFDVALDLRLAAGFRREVLDALQRIPSGTVRTYGTLARELGRPGAARAVGTACARNPLPLLVPCHRVVPGSGGTGNYLGGSDAKVRLLALEREG